MSGGLRRKAQTTVEEVQKRRKTGLFSLWTNYLHLTARHNHQVRVLKTEEILAATQNLLINFIVTIIVS
jgi:hypothetical protein